MAGAGGGVFTGGEPLSDQGRLTAGDFSEIFQEHWQSFFRWTNVDRAYLGVWSGLQAVSRGLGVVVSWMERNALALLVALAAIILLAAKWFLPGEGTWWIHENKWELAVPVVNPTHVPVILVVACATAAIALLFAALSRESTRRLLPLMTLAAASTVAGLIVSEPRIHSALLELGAFVTVALVWQSARMLTAKLTYLAVVLLSALPFFGELLGADQFWLWAFLLTGICVKLAAIPLLFWLLAIADEVPALVLGLIIAVIDMAAFGEFYVLSWGLPDHAGFDPSVVLLVAASATSLVAALLMVTQRSLKRLLVLSTVEDVGFLLFGAFSLKTLGFDGAIIAATTHALAKTLLFVCLAAPEADGALDSDPVALAARYPVSAFGFLFGMLAMLGIPPTLGFLGRWRLYSVALETGLCPLTIFIVSSILALIAYTLALTRNWWGPPPDTPQQTQAREPFAIKAVIVVLVAILLAAGIWPNAWQMLMGVRP
jgi:hypothetical protein